jgi:cell division protein FtsB
MRIMPIVFLALIAALQYELWFSPGGIAQSWHLKRQIAQTNTQNAGLAERNAVVAADIRDLKKGKDAIEERARNDLGMVKKGETFYQVVPKSDSTRR